ncbi:MAG: hypothetical protein ACE5MG_02205 [Candidatus Methylomirabilales bacterium]
MNIASSRQCIRWSMVLGLVLSLLPGQAQALSLDLSSPQIREAIRYGHSSQEIPFALFVREWRAEGIPGPGQRLVGSAWLQSPFARLAHAGWAAAHRGLSVTGRDLTRQLESVRGRLAFAVTLVTPSTHTSTYHVSLHQAGEAFDASHVESRHDPAERGTSWVYLYCLFPAEKIDLQGTVVLVVTDAQGDSLPFVFDLSGIR